MATLKLLLSLLFISFIISMATGQTDDPRIDCESACKYRCSLSSRQNLCHRACATCCERCNCVPPGTFGNNEICPCYWQMTTRGGRRKCP